MPGVHCISAGGAFYAFPDMRQAIQSLAQRGVIKAANDLAFSEYLLEKSGVAVVLGSARKATSGFHLPHPWTI